LVEDPEEKNNLAGQQAATAAVLKDKLQILLRNRPLTPATDQSSKLSPDAADKLRALGYVAYRSPVSAEALAKGLPDPKTKLWEFNSILEAEDAFQRREEDHAEGLLRQVQEQDPGLYVIPFLLGESAVRRQNWAGAEDYLQRCLKLNPNFDSAMTGLALALSKLGRGEEAKGWLQRAVQSNPQNYRAWYEAGLLAASSNADAALADYQKATIIQPNFFPGQRELGLALFNRKDYVAAAIHLEKALALGVDDAHLHNFLGICYSQMHQLSRAVREHGRAIDLEPNLAEAHLNLGYDYQLQHQTNAARKQYQSACSLDSGFCKFVPAQ
jgi:Flp pilus assembly protein TadD